MLISRDQNTQSAPNFFKRNQTGNNHYLHNNPSRKSILRKHEEKKDEIKQEVEGIRKTIREFNKQNSRFGVSIVVDRKSCERSSDTFSNQQKKKTAFLQSLVDLQKSKNESKSKKMTYLSSGSDKTSGKSYQHNYKQSKVDIIFSNSNISSDDIWDIDEVSEKKQSTKQQLLNSNTVEVLSVGSSIEDNRVPKINLKTVNKYQVRNTDRIMEESDDKDYGESRTSNIFTSKHTMSTKNPSQCQLTTCSTNFRKTSYYQGFEEQENDKQQQFFTIIESPPISQKKEKYNFNNVINVKPQNGKSQNLLKASKSETMLSNVQKKSIYLQKIERSRQKRKQFLGESVYQHPEQLGFTVGFTESNVISKSTFMTRVDKSLEFREQMFEKINLYRFLNRLQYKISKFLSFDANQQILQRFINEIIKQKCYILLNSEIELESLTKSQRKFDEKERDIFLQIVQAYIQKEKKKPYWKQVKEEFEKVSFLCFSLNETALQFIQQTISSLQYSLKPIRGKIDRGLFTEQTLLFQLRLKIMKYLHYDLFKLNLAQHSHPSDIRDTPINKQRRLKKIIEENEWEVKIAFKQLLEQFKLLKHDVEQMNV